MSAIYDAISDLMDSCVKELRKSSKIDTSQLTLEHGLFKSFDDIVRRQLDSVWHTVSPKTKQVSCINFLHDLQSLVNATSSTVWLFCACKLGITVSTTTNTESSIQFSQLLFKVLAHTYLACDAVLITLLCQLEGSSGHLLVCAVGARSEDSQSTG